jgi:tetratricopeptide (TPR) repeat protein
MKFKLSFVGYILSVFLITSCINIFSIIPGGEPETVDNVNRLLDMGEYYINQFEYEKAYRSYKRALEIEPTNSIALEGASTAYLFWKLPVTEVINAFLEGSLSNINFNTLYDVSGVISPYLYKIINQKADGAIPYNDIGLNVNFFFFNSLYGVFYLVNTSGDGNVVQNTNDLFTINPDLSISNRLDTVTNSFVDSLRLLVLLDKRIPTFDTIVARSEQSLNIVQDSMTSSTAKEMLDGIADSLGELTGFLTDSLSEIEGMTSLSHYGIDDANEITNVIGEFYTKDDYDIFTNDLYQAGITNINDVTNYFPDLTNISDIIDDYFGL